MFKSNNEEIKHFYDSLISDFTDPLFVKAFQKYFAELGIEVKDWDGVFAEMNNEGDNESFVRKNTDNQVIGFILCKPISFTSWFFEETCVFIREFWISEEYRNKGHGADLLLMAEDHYKQKGIFTSVLTTDTAEDFYIKHGYIKKPACKAKNEDDVYVKALA